MPYTFAHPGFIFFIPKKWLAHFNLLGLTIGSIVPDFDILFRLTHSRFHIFTYNASDILLIILPISVAITFYYSFFFLYLKNKPLKITISETFKLVYSCLLAIFLHLLLDNITHLNAAEITRKLDHQTDFSFAFYNRLYYFIIYGPLVFSSIIGIFLIKYAYDWKGITKQFLLVNNKFWKLLLISLGITFILFLSLKFYLTGTEVGFFIDSVIVAITASLTFTFLATPLNSFIILKLIKKGTL
jgi:hypothetical protein